jgi:hypothetical protein
MSKKLIAVAAAAALALTGLVATPATSAGVGPFAVAVTGNIAGSGLTSANAYTVLIPTQDVLRLDGVGATVTLIRAESTTPITTDNVRVVTTGGVKVISKAGYDALTATTNKTTAGSSDATVASSGGNAVFYIYSTSTTAGTATVSSSSGSTTFYVKGTTPAPYNVVVKAAPATAATSTDTVIDFTVTDAFGNAIEADITAVITKVGPVTLSNGAELSWDTDRLTMYTTVVGTAAGSASVNVELGATKITAFGTPKTVFFTVAVGGTQTELIAALTAQVAALTADYNALATRWNKKVDSGRKVFKKVALK